MSDQDNGPAAREIQVVRFYDDRDDLNFETDFRPVVIPADAEEVPSPKVESAPEPVEASVKKSDEPAPPAETPVKRAPSANKVPVPGKLAS